MVNNSKQLLTIAAGGIEILSSGYKKLPQKGIFEVMLFNTNFVLGNSSIDSKQRKDIEDEYFSTLYSMIEKEIPGISQEDLLLFFNGRLSFYFEEYEKLRNNSFHTPMLIYSNFYVNPLQNNSSIIAIEKFIDFTELLLFESALFDMINWVQKSIEQQ